MLTRDLGREHVSMMGGYGGRELAAAVRPNPLEVDNELSFLLRFPDSSIKRVGFTGC
jgi:hypothetical protein